MVQEDMSWEMFTSIIDNIENPSLVTLQGEGEPSLHPRFWDMVDYVFQKNHTVDTTLNGTQLDTELIPKYFKRINISIDSLDTELCNSIGRVNLPKVLKNIDELSKVMPASAIIIRTVDFGQSLSDLKNFINEHKFGWTTQNIQKKQDYTNTYTGRFLNTVYVNRPRVSLCSFLRSDCMRYYTVNGLELPCPMIKDITGITTIAAMKTRMPRACTGCSM